MAEYEENEEQLPKGEKEMSFLEHLEEFRWHIIRSLGSIGVFAIVAFILREQIWYHIILAPSRPDFWTYEMFCRLGKLTGAEFFCIDELNFIIQSRRMTAQFTMALVSSFVIGLIVAFPYAFWEFWRFVRPGLYQNEKQLSRGAVFFVTLLFLSGVLFGYFIVSPISINFLTNFTLDDSIMNEIDLNSYVSTVMMLVLACGIMFQLPIVVYFLTKAGIISPEFLKTYRKHAIVVILVLSALITPPDVISQILMCFPLMFLYEISIMVATAIKRKEDRLALEETLE
ncbi:MAG: twin-arginine translocase subunit TatC [Cytophagales bacterium]|nr:twin-arginine translocase subunit TatC [Cytophagales bacterium]